MRCTLLRRLLSVVLLLCFSMTSALADMFYPAYLMDWFGEKTYQDFQDSDEFTQAYDAALAVLDAGASIPELFNCLTDEETTSSAIYAIEPSDDKNEFCFIYVFRTDIWLVQFSTLDNGYIIEHLYHSETPLSEEDADAFVQAYLLEHMVTIDVTIEPTIFWECVLTIYFTVTGDASTMEGAGGRLGAEMQQVYKANGTYSITITVEFTPTEEMSDFEFRLEDGTRFDAIVHDNGTITGTIVVPTPGTYKLFLYYKVNGEEVSRGWLPRVSKYQFTVLKKGSRGDTVKDVQQRLILLGFLNDKADGSYGNNTVNAVKAFQAAFGLPETGIIDELTWLAILRESCTHDYCPPRQENIPLVVAADEDTHLIRYVRQSYCGFCDKLLANIEDPADTLEEHNFDGNVCTVCGYEKPDIPPDKPVVTDFYIKSDGKLYIAWQAYPDASQYKVKIVANSQDGYSSLTSEKSVNGHDHTFSFDLLDQLDGYSDRNMMLRADVSAITDYDYSYQYESPQPISITVPFAIQRACSHKYCEDLDPKLEYTSKKHRVVRYKKCKDCGAVLLGEILYEKEEHQLNIRGQCKFSYNGEACGYKKQWNYKALLNNLEDGQNPLDDIGIWAFMQEKLKRSPLSEKQVEMILNMIHDAPPLYRDLAVYAFGEYDIDRDGFLLLKPTLDKSVYNPVLKRIVIQESDEEGDDVERQVVFFHEMGHAIDGVVANVKTPMIEYATYTYNEIYNHLKKDTYGFLRSIIHMKLKEKAADTLTSGDSYTLKDMTIALFGEDLSSYFPKNITLDELVTQATEDLTVFMSDMGVNGKTGTEWINKLWESSDAKSIADKASSLGFVQDYLKPCGDVVKEKLGIHTPYLNAYMAADILGGRVNDFVVQSGHRSGSYWYYTFPKGRTGNLEMEAWAEYFAAQLSGNSAAVMFNYAYFPITCEYFDELAKKWLKGLKDGIWD